MVRGMGNLARDQAVNRPLARVLVGTRGLFGSFLVQTGISLLCFIADMCTLAVIVPYLLSI